MLAGYERAVGRIAQRGNLHKAPHAAFDAGLSQRQRRVVMDGVEAALARLAQDAGDIDHGIDAIEHWCPVPGCVQSLEVAVARVRVRVSGLRRAHAS